MTKKNRALAILIGSALFTSAARFSYSYLRFNEVGRRFHRVKPGLTRQQVLDALGDPSESRAKCGKHHIAEKGCAHEFVYSPPLAPMFDDYYIVQFGRDDRVVAAQHYTP